MARNITTVTHPDGSVSKRTSARATYTHAVVAGPVDPKVAAADLTRRADALDALAEQTEAALVNPEFTIVARGFGHGDTGRSGDPVYHNYEIRLVGSAAETSTYCNSRGESQQFDHDAPRDENGRTPQYVTDARQVVTAAAERGAARHRSAAAALRTEAAQWLSGELTDNGYAVVRWSSREDLARKAVASHEIGHLAEKGYALAVVPVD